MIALWNNQILPGSSSIGRRLIALHPGETAILGRTSKNQKTEFMAKSTNGYFDNPIISRRHAILQNSSVGVLSHPHRWDGLC